MPTIRDDLIVAMGSAIRDRMEQSSVVDECDLAEAALKTIEEIGFRVVPLGPTIGMHMTAGLATGQLWAKGAVDGEPIRPGHIFSAQYRAAVATPWMDHESGHDKN